MKYAWNGKYSFNGDVIHDINAIIDTAYREYGLLIRNRDGAKSPLVLPDVVQFNGDGSHGESAQAFILFGGDGSCDTADKPYSLVVGTVLLRLYLLQSSDGFSLTSDSRWDDTSWKQSRVLYHLTFGKDPVRPATIK